MSTIGDFIINNSLAVFVGGMIGFSVFVVISFIEGGIETIADAIKSRRKQDEAEAEDR